MSSLIHQMESYSQWSLFIFLTTPSKSIETTKEFHFLFFTCFFTFHISISSNAFFSIQMLERNKYYSKSFHWNRFSRIALQIPALLWTEWSYNCSRILINTEEWRLSSFCECRHGSIQASLFGNRNKVYESLFSCYSLKICVDPTDERQPLNCAFEQVENIMIWKMYSSSLIHSIHRLVSLQDIRLCSKCLAISLWATISKKKPFFMHGIFWQKN